jgi:hypothetical protein
MTPVDQRWRAWLSPPKKALLLYRSLRLFRSELEIEGVSEGPRHPCVYIGEGLSLAYYRKLYRSDTPSECVPVPLWSLRREIALARARCPVTLVEINQLLEFMLPAGGGVTYPWIRQETDLTGEAYRRRKRGIEHNFGNRVRRFKFRSRLSQDPRDVEEFHREYYLPHLSSRHGELALFGRSLAQLQKAVTSGFLLQVWWGERWVSGMVVEGLRAERLHPLAVGLHPSCLQSWQNGALAAAYYFLFRWARENGVRIVDLGGSPPNRMDGLFHHKALWAAEPKRDAWHHTEIVFYVDPAAHLPPIVAEQLVWETDRFVSLAESVRRETRG